MDFLVIWMSALIMLMDLLVLCMISQPILIILVFTIVGTILIWEMCFRRLLVGLLTPAKIDVAVQTKSGSQVEAGTQTELGIEVHAGVQTESVTQADAGVQADAGIEAKNEDQNEAGGETGGPAAKTDAEKLEDDRKSFEQSRQTLEAINELLKMTKEDTRNKDEAFLKELDEEEALLRSLADLVEFNTKEYMRQITQNCGIELNTWILGIRSILAAVWHVHIFREFMHRIEINRQDAVIRLAMGASEDEEPDIAMLEAHYINHMMVFPENEADTNGTDAAGTENTNTDKPNGGKSPADKTKTSEAKMNQPKISKTKTSKTKTDEGVTEKFNTTKPGISKPNSGKPSSSKVDTDEVKQDKINAGKLSKGKQKIIISVPDTEKAEAHPVDDEDKEMYSHPLSKKEKRKLKKAEKAEKATMENGEKS
ncbi:hypothetical protein CORC01_08731 [Colletotrichum orchidophilum]|uniref:Uncharacterized protein n=1 Tax=Colletotrichum orchidophilum TaxID=1209926 RepID=A0A1G4B3P6_9PEZI|nr:uncharacterized protein CORC01_08731 [Colletotrichum orchidophilum]OHE96038.1 hypothetical protein CORC01_08731 [Colletotrichum orchidophilum]